MIFNFHWKINYSWWWLRPEQISRCWRIRFTGRTYCWWSERQTIWISMAGGYFNYGRYFSYSVAANVWKICPVGCEMIQVCQGCQSLQKITCFKKNDSVTSQTLAVSRYSRWRSRWPTNHTCSFFSGNIDRTYVFLVSLRVFRVKESKNIFNSSQIITLPWRFRPRPWIVSHRYLED